MADAKNKGFILTLVIVSISLIGIVMFVLTGSSKTMLFQSDSMYLQAARHNLTASGLDWVRQNIRAQGQEIFGKIIELDATNMGIRDPVLKVTLESSIGSQIKVRISTTCARGGRTLRSADEYRITSK